MAEMSAVLSKIHDDGSYSNKRGPPSICLFVEHDCSEMSHSLYLIHLPLDLSNYDEMVDSDGFMLDSKYISPVLAFPEENHFIPFSASVNLGSKIYFLGGSLSCMEASSRVKKRLAHQVQVFDTAHPEQGMQCVAPMNAPKETPCVFVADGIIYALGAASPNHHTYPDGKDTGFFECYDPASDHWKVLPDPPLPLVVWVDANLLDSATVVGRRVFIVAKHNCLIFNLDIQDWDPLPRENLAVHFPYSPCFVQDTTSLYHLRGHGIFKDGTSTMTYGGYSDKLVQVVKRGPLSISKDGDHLSSLLKDLVPDKEHVMAVDLDENKFFTKQSYCPWRDLFHMGGRFFCYIVTAPLVDFDSGTHEEPNSRGVWIKFFEEVQVHTNSRKIYDKTEFRSLASFCYKIKTNFQSQSTFIRCSVIGTIPTSWINASLKITQDKNPKHMNKESEDFHLEMCTMQDRNLVMKTERREYKTKQSCNYLENVENREAGDYDMKRKLLAVREELNNRLEAELAKKYEVLKIYKALLAKTGVGA